MDDLFDPMTEQAYGEGIIEEFASYHTMPSGGDRYGNIPIMREGKIALKKASDLLGMFS